MLGINFLWQKRQSFEILLAVKHCVSHHWIQCVKGMWMPNNNDNVFWFNLLCLYSASGTRVCVINWNRYCNICKPDILLLPKFYELRVPQSRTHGDLICFCVFGVSPTLLSFCRSSLNYLMQSFACDRTLHCLIVSIRYKTYQEGWKQPKLAEHQKVFQLARILLKCGIAHTVRGSTCRGNCHEMLTCCSGVAALMNCWAQRIFVTSATKG